MTLGEGVAGDCIMKLLRKEPSLRFKIRDKNQNLQNGETFSLKPGSPGRRSLQFLIFVMSKEIDGEKIY